MNIPRAIYYTYTRDDGTVAKTEIGLKTACCMLGEDAVQIVLESGKTQKVDHPTEADTQIFFMF